MAETIKYGILQSEKGLELIKLDSLEDRNLLYSEWHKKFLDRKCYATDIDFLEYRYEVVNGKRVIVPKALIVLQNWSITQPKFLEENSNFLGIKKFAENSKIPFYVVWYLDDGSGNIQKFKVWDTNKSRETATEMKQEEYKKFVEGL